MYHVHGDNMYVYIVS